MNPISRIALPLLVASGTLLVAAGAHAQYTGPSDQPTINTVKDVLDNGRDDMDVQLTGRITKRLGDEDYLFADDTGEIQVEIDDDGRLEYEIDLLTPDGHKIEFEFDARTGEQLEVKGRGLRDARR